MIAYVTKTLTVAFILLASVFIYSKAQDTVNKISTPSICGHNFCISTDLDWKAQSITPVEDFVLYELEIKDPDTNADPLILNIYEGNAPNLPEEKFIQNTKRCDTSALSIKTLIVMVPSPDDGPVRYQHWIASSSKNEWPSALHLWAEIPEGSHSIDISNFGVGVFLYGSDLNTLNC